MVFDFQKEKSIVNLSKRLREKTKISITGEITDSPVMAVSLLENGTDPEELVFSLVPEFSIASNKNYKKLYTSTAKVVSESGVNKSNFNKFIHEFHFFLVKRKRFFVYLFFISDYQVYFVYNKDFSTKNSIYLSSLSRLSKIKIEENGTIYFLIEGFGSRKIYFIIKNKRQFLNLLNSKNLFETTRKAFRRKIEEYIILNFSEKQQKKIFNKLNLRQYTETEKLKIYINE